MQMAPAARPEDSAPITRPAPETDPFFGAADPREYWGSEDEEDLGADENRLHLDPPRTARDSRGRAGRSVRAARTASRGNVLSGLRSLIGLDRQVPRTRKGKRSTGEGPAWLADLGQDDTDDGDVRDGLGTVAPQQETHRADVADTPVRAAFPRRGLVDPNMDLQVVKAPREWSSTVRRVLVVTVLALFLVAGVKQVLWNPIFGAKASAAPAVVALDPAAADAAAARYALDYFSYSPTAAAAGESALAAEVVGGADSTAVRWTGTGYLHADAALPGAAQVIDPAHAVVQVTVRVSVGMPPTPKPGATPTTASSTAAAVSGGSADPGVLPVGWADLGSRWLTVAVPIDATSGAVKVAASGPVLSGEKPGQVTTVAGAVGDSRTSQATQAVAGQFFAAYARSDVAYLAAPGVNLGGLSGAVSFVSLTNWTVAGPPTAGTGTATSGVGTGTVTWRVPGTDLQVKQQYAMALSNSQSRWYAAALSPFSPIPAQ